MPKAARLALVLGSCLLAVTATGCGRTIDGVAVPAGSSQQVDMNFDKLMRECEVVPAATIGEVVAGVPTASPEFNGAVCMWQVNNALVTLNWYENGTLSNEKITYKKLGYPATSVEVGSSRGLQIRRPGDPDSCGVTASAPDSGVVGWWVNYLPGTSHPDPCEPVKKLVELTLNRAR